MRRRLLFRFRKLSIDKSYEQTGESIRDGIGGIEIKAVCRYVNIYGCAIQSL